MIGGPRDEGKCACENSWPAAMKEASEVQRGVCEAAGLREDRGQKNEGGSYTPCRDQTSGPQHDIWVGPESEFSPATSRGK